MNGLPELGRNPAIAAANEAFELEMQRLKEALAHARSSEEEAAIDQQMRECESRHREQLATLQRSMY